MKKRYIFCALFLCLAAKSLDDEVIENLDFLLAYEIVEDEETYKLAEEEKLNDDKDEANDESAD